MICFQHLYVLFIFMSMGWLKREEETLQCSCNLIIMLIVC